MSAGLDRHGPAASDYVGRVEAARDGARVARGAAAARRARPALDLRWTRICFCGQEIDGRPVASIVRRSGMPVPDRLRGGARPAVRRHQRALRGPARCRSTTASRTATRSRLGHRRRAARRAAAGVRVGRRHDRLGAGRGHQGGGRAHPRGRRARPSPGSGIERRGASPGWRTSSSSTSRRPRSTTASTTRAATPTSARMSSVLVQRELAKLAGTLARGEPAPAPFAFDSDERRDARRSALRRRRGRRPRSRASPARPTGGSSARPCRGSGGAAGPRPAGRPRRS